MGAIVLFDGVCNFCNGAVNWVIERDAAGYFKFAALQSEYGQEVVKARIKKLIGIDSIILLEDDKLYFYSTAALRIARRLDGIWSWAYVLIVVPRPIRDLFYKLFAKYRYKLFGKQEACMMPTPEIKTRFL